jgi:hypothetical protein
MLARDKLSIRSVVGDENKVFGRRLVVIGDIVFVKPCLFKGRIETETWYEMLR